GSGSLRTAATVLRRSASCTLAPEPGGGAGDRRPALAPAAGRGMLGGWPSRPAARKEAAMASNLSSGQTILLIEDHPGEREGLAALLRAEGYGVSPVASVDEGLACLRSGGVDLVLLGMMLPGKDGWYFLSQRLRDRALAAVPVLITTSLHVACQEWARS